jgi:hypothetical protein
MLTQPERRREARITVPQHLRRGEPEHHLVHVLNLSRLGARIAHREPLQAGGVWYVDLPPELGDLRLTARVVWTRLLGTERMMEGARRRAYESGIEFTGPTAEQQTALAAVLATLQAETPTPDRVPSA